MDVSRILIDSLKSQDIYIKEPDEVPVNVYVEDGLDAFLAFYVDETDDWLTVAETTVRGTEEIRIINKSKIIKIDVCYQTEKILERDNNVERSYI